EPRDRQQKAEKSETWNRLDDVGASQNRFIPRRLPRNQNAQRNADEHRQRNGNTHQAEVFDGQGENFRAMSIKEFEQVHRSPPLAFPILTNRAPSCRPAVSQRTARPADRSRKETP